MTEPMAKVHAIPVSNAVMAATTEKSQLLATAWLVILGLVFGASLLCTAVLLAWPLVAEYASKLN
jgi:hypothetical protein